LEPLTITNNSSDVLFSDDSISGDVGAMEVGTFPLFPSPATVKVNNAPFGKGIRQNGLPFKWNMNPDEPSLEIEQKRSIMKAKSCKGQREMVKRKYLQLQELVKQLDNKMNYLSRRITQLEGDNERLSTNNISLLENEREERSNINHNDRGIELMDADTAALSCSFDMESLY